MSEEEMKAEEIYQTLAEHDIAYYEKRIVQLKDPRDRWRCRLLFEPCSASKTEICCFKEILGEA